MTKPTYSLVCGSVGHMLPHVPTPEMVRLHTWHVYVQNHPMYDSLKPILIYTGTHEECSKYVAGREAVQS